MGDTRAFEMTIEIAVSADAVWQALTDATELVRWFPTEASVTPGRGGRWVISWDGNWPWNTEIDRWEPPAHLRLVDRHARPFDARGANVDQSVAALPIAIDWYLEGKGGSTSVRLVHSGFGRGGAWDDEFDGVSVGWQLELNGLKHYLERHRGQDRRVAWTRRVVAAPPQALWATIAGPNGIVRDAALQPGDYYSTTLSTGDRLEGIVAAAIANRGLQVTVKPWNEALFRLWVDKVGHESAVNAWLSTYGMQDQLVNDFEARLHVEIDRIAAAVASA